MKIKVTQDFIDYRTDKSQIYNQRGRSDRKFLMDHDAKHTQHTTCWVCLGDIAKVPGVKPGRPNPLGLPDLTKPSGWSGPDHSNNLGDLERIIN